MRRDHLTESDIAAFSPSEKVGLVATLGPDGLPHVSLLTTLQARGDRGLTIGQFSVGLSKANMEARPPVGFLVMGLDRRLWRGRARWTGKATEGPEYVAYNRQPMFRYNTYFGINTVHYLDLVDLEGPEALPLGAFVAASLATLVGAPGARPRGATVSGEAPREVLPAPARDILDRLTSLNFLAYVDPEGYPRLVPALQARSAGPSRIVLSPGPYGREIGAIPVDRPVALMSLNLSMESFLCRGAFSRPGGRGLYVLDLDYLYNAAPPAHGQVYPPLPLRTLATP